LKKKLINTIRLKKNSLADSGIPFLISALLVFGIPSSTNEFTYRSHVATGSTTALVAP
jgi:hypothetical protein